MSPYINTLTKAPRRSSSLSEAARTQGTCTENKPDAPQMRAGQTRHAVTTPGSVYNI